MFVFGGLLNRSSWEPILQVLPLCHPGGALLCLSTSFGHTSHRIHLVGRHSARGFQFGVGFSVAIQKPSEVNGVWIGIISPQKNCLEYKLSEPKISLFKLNHHLDVPVWVPYDGSGTRCQCFPSLFWSIMPVTVLHNHALLSPHNWGTTPFAKWHKLMAYEWGAHPN